MGVLANAAAIVFGGLLGSLVGVKLSRMASRIIAISVMLISAAGVIENLFTVSEGVLSAPSLYIIALILVIGALVGEWLRLEERLSHLASTDKPYLNGIIDSSVFFGIGGLQICGSILLAVEGDSSQLFLKSAIDLPLAIMFGAVYGRSVALSSIPVMLIQVLIALIAYFFGDFFSPDMIKDLSVIGYVILFFSGFNLITTEPKHKINNTNMLPAILIVIAYHAIAGFWS